MRKTLILTFILLSNSCFASNFLTGSIYERIANEVGLDPLLLYSVSISESGFSMSWNLQGIKDYYSFLCKEYGLKDELSNKPKVTFL